VGSVHGKLVRPIEFSVVRARLRARITGNDYVRSGEFNQALVLIIGRYHY
jgi:hypothetical protein